MLRLASKTGSTLAGKQVEYGIYILVIDLALAFRLNQSSYLYSTPLLTDIGKFELACSVLGSAAKVRGYDGFSV